jgi:hypothetical protein
MIIVIKYAGFLEARHKGAKGTIHLMRKIAY